MRLSERIRKRQSMVWSSLAAWRSTDFRARLKEKALASLFGGRLIMSQRDSTWKKCHLVEGNFEQSNYELHKVDMVL